MLPDTTRPQKSHYSESEAAVALGLSVDDLRSLVRAHILKNNEEDASHMSSATYQPSDLLILRMVLRGLNTSQPEQETVQSAPTN